ncbi:UNKNOWN [Stylonychia lemnae]|uniref:Uncharacterized protein n=1 Tax=Stylonychia lemnae TaxID=5949 RepID=A0A078B3I9_STYLE|nr:UNKNOWN [Stylonychia lemnae]|eukprot:CDW87797.1 UNKNOWN [Stylonychia lemnae]
MQVHSGYYELDQKPTIMSMTQASIGSLIRKDQLSLPLINQETLEIQVNFKRDRIFVYAQNELKMFDIHLEKEFDSIRTDRYSTSRFHLHTDKRLIFFEGCQSKIKVFEISSNKFKLIQTILSCQLIKGFLAFSPKIFGYFDQNLILYKYDNESQIYTRIMISRIHPHDVHLSDYSQSLSNYYEPRDNRKFY